jgi:hypothetical protein
MSLGMLPVSQPSGLTSYLLCPVLRPLERENLIVMWSEIDSEAASAWETAAYRSHDPVTD